MLFHPVHLIDPHSITKLYKYCVTPERILYEFNYTLLKSLMVCNLRKATCINSSTTISTERWSLPNLFFIKHIRINFLSQLPCVDSSGKSRFVEVADRPRATTRISQPKSCMTFGPNKAFLFFSFYFFILLVDIFLIIMLYGLGF